MCISFIAAPLQLTAGGVKGVDALTGSLSSSVPLRLYLTGSDQLWADTKSYRPTPLVWRSLCSKISCVPSEWTEPKVVNGNSRARSNAKGHQQRNGTQSVIYGVPICHQSVVTLEACFLGLIKAAPGFLFLSVQCMRNWGDLLLRYPVHPGLPGTFLAPALTIPCLGKSHNPWESGRVGPPGWATVCQGLPPPSADWATLKSWSPDPLPVLRSCASFEAPSIS